MPNVPAAGQSRGIVLDFDGVIVQSVERHAEAYRAIMRPYGVAVTDQMVFDREGGRSESLIRDFLRLAGWAQADEETVKKLSMAKQERYVALGPPPLYPGAEAMVATARRAVDRLGLVTGTRRVNVERLIPGLLPYFDVVIAQDGYQHDKPHPEPYEKAAAAMGVPLTRCAALENAAKGVMSATAAGYGFVVGITTTMPAEALRRAGAHIVVSTHDDAAMQLADWARQD